MAERTLPFTELIAKATTSAIHLEMRDTYTPRDPDYLAWLAGASQSHCSAQISTSNGQRSSALTRLED